MNTLLPPRLNRRLRATVATFVLALVGLFTLATAEARDPLIEASGRITHPTKQFATVTAHATHVLYAPADGIVRAITVPERATVAEGAQLLRLELAPAQDAALTTRAALDQLRPSVIVADIALPDEDGYSFIRRVRAHPTPGIQAIPAIAVTAYATIPDRAEALAVGFQQHLAKPIDPERVIQVIRELGEAEADNTAV